MRIRHTLCGGALALTVGLLAGCGADVQKSDRDAAAGYPVTINNCGQQKAFDRAPQHTVVNDINMTEMMFALGLQDHMAGYTFSNGQNGQIARSPWQDDFGKVPRLSHSYINKEIVQGADADLVFAGWNYGFSESTGLTPDTLQDIGIPSYLLTESCHQQGSTARGIMDPIDALYTDIDNLGQIYGVSDRAHKLIDGYKRTIADAQSGIPEERPRPKVFLYDSGTDQPFTVGTRAAGNDVITKAGGDNIFSDLDDSWTKATFESAADRDPDVILICDYGDGPEDSVQAKEDFLRHQPLMANTKAVKENHFVVLTYPQLTEGPQNPQAIADFAKYLRSLGS